MTQTAPSGLTGSLKPLQRFACKSCKSSFTYGRSKARVGSKFADDVVLESVRLYIQGLTSYRVLASLVEGRVGRPVGRVTINNPLMSRGSLP